MLLLPTLLLPIPSHPTPPHSTPQGAATPPSINHTVSERMTGQAGAMMLLDLCLLPWPRRGPACLRLHVFRLLTRRKLHRLLLTLASVAAYTKLRSWLAGDHLVRIYRKVCPSHSRQRFNTCCTALICSVQWDCCQAASLCFCDTADRVSTQQLAAKQLCLFQMLAYKQGSCAGAACLLALLSGCNWGSCCDFGPIASSTSALNKTPLTSQLVFV